MTGATPSLDGNKIKVIRAFRNQCILGDTYGYWGSYGF